MGGPVTDTAGVRFWKVDNDTGRDGWIKESSLSLAGTQDTVAPATPIGLTAVGAAYDQVNLTWNIARDNVAAGIVMYDIYRNGIKIASTASLNFQDTGLSANTNYTYAIQARDMVGNTSAQTGSVGATTLAPLASNPLDAMAPGTWYAVPNSQIKKIDFIWPGNQTSGNYTDYFTESSATYDSTRNRFYIHGGGHNDYYGNEIYAFDINTLQWRTIRQPGLDVDPNSAIEASGYYPDTNGNPDLQQPRSVHSYNYIQYVPAIDRFCRFGTTAPYPTGQRTTKQLNCYDINNNRWEQKKDVTYFGGSVVPSTAVDPATGHVWNWPGIGTLSEWSPLTDSWVVRGPNENDSGYYTAVIDTKRHRFVRFGAGGLYWYDLNASGILSVNKGPLTGDIEIVKGRRSGFAYDSVDDVYVAWNGEATDENGDISIDHVILPEDIYVINPDTFAVTRIGTSALSSIPRNSWALNNGANNATFSRFSYIPSKNVFILVNNHKNEPVFFYKLDPNAVKGVVPSDKVAPSAASNLSAQATSNTSISLVWNAATDNVGVVGYRIARHADAQQLVTITTSGTSYTDSGLIAGAKYSYAVIPYDAAGNIGTMSVVTLTATAGASAGGALVAPVVVQPGAPDAQAPSIPQNLRTTPTSPNAVSLVWNAATDNVGVTGYKVFRNGTQISTSQGASYSDTGLATSTLYTYTVSAYDAAGNNSAQSSSVSTTTLAAAPVVNQVPPANQNQGPQDVQAPTVPQGLSVSAASSFQANLSWTAATDNVAVTGYKVFRNGVQIGTALSSSYVDSGLSPATSYTYAVSAYDAAGNNSAQSTSANVVTAGVNLNVGSLNIPITINELLPSGESGTTRTNGLASFGIPLKDGDNIRSVSQLGLSGAAVYQFKPLSYHPSGNLQWVLVDTLANIPAGGTATVTLTNGSGSSGGPNMAVDVGNAVNVDTGVAQFTIRKNGFNIFDKVVVNGTTLVESGNNGGAVLTLPGNLTYSSLYDTPTVTVTENGPAKSVVKVEGRFKDAAGNQAPLGYTLYLTFSKNSSSVKVVPVLRNAYYATHSVIPINSFELVLGTALKQNLSYSLPTSKGNQTGVLASGDNVYLFQGYTKRLADTSYSDFWQWNIGGYFIPPVNYTTDIGTRFVKNETVVKDFIADNLTDYALGYGELKDTNDDGVTVAYRNMAAYFPSGLEFNGNGEVTVGIFSKRNNKTGLGIDWGVHESRDLMFNFHTTPVDNAAINTENQTPLFGRAAFEQYRDSGAFFGEKRLASMQEQQTIFAANGRPNFTIPNSSRAVTRLWDSSQGGTLNQRDIALAWQLTYVRNGNTGQMLNALERTHFVSDQFPWYSDDFDFGTARNDYHYNRLVPTKPIDGGINGMEDDFEHIWVYSVFMSYYFTGDERYKDAVTELAESAYNRYGGAADGNIEYRLGLSGARVAAQSYMLTGNTRYLTKIDRYVDYLLSTETKYPGKPDVGRNLTRGYTAAPVNGYPQASHSMFSTTYFPATLYEVYRYTPEGHVYQNAAYPGLSYTKQDLMDFLEGLGYFNLKESYRYPANNGKPWVAYDYDVTVPDTSKDGRTYDFGRGASIAYEATGDSTFLTLGKQLAVNVDKDQDTVANSDIGNLRFLYDVAHAGDVKVSFVPLDVTPLGGGTYRISWTAPAGMDVYQLKYANKNIVPNLNFNSLTFTYEFDPASNIAFWAATNVPNMPQVASAGTAQSVTLSNLSCGNTCQFKLRASALTNGYTQPNFANPGNPAQPAPVVPVVPVNNGGSSAGDTQAPSVSITNSNLGGSLSGTIAVTAVATDNVGVVGVVLKVDGQALTEDVSAPYTFSFNTQSVTNGAHVLTAEARDAAGNKTVSSNVSVIVSNIVVTPPKLLSMNSSASSTGAVISIGADRVVTATVEYGITASYGQVQSAAAAMSSVVTIPNLLPGTLYHFRVRITDGVTAPLVSEDSTFKTTTLASANSNLAPINNLNIKERAAKALQLAWSAPANSGQFVKPTAYEVRYIANDVISVDNWTAATLLPSNAVKAPEAAGLTESLKLQNLLPGTTYSIGVRTKDDSGNLSPISNVVTVKTKALPPKPNLVAVTFGSVILSWSAADYPDGSVYFKVIRSDSTLTGPNDAAAIVVGTTTLPTMIDVNVNEGRTYYYGIFSVNDTGDFSDMTTTSVTVPVKGSSGSSGGGSVSSGGSSSGTVSNAGAGGSVSLSLGNGAIGAVGGSTGSTGTGSGAVVYVTVFKNPLYVVLRSNEVRLLQQFLIKTGYLEVGSDSGFYGVATKAAVGKFQCAQGLGCDSSVEGYGLVGPLTRAKLNAASGGAVSATPTSAVGTQVQTSAASSFTRNLKVGMRGEDVRLLQQFLNIHGFTVASSGAGSLGNETTYFGVATSRALAKFQEAHTAEILTPNGLTRGSGFFGAGTRAFIKTLK